MKKMLALTLAGRWQYLCLSWRQQARRRIHTARHLLRLRQQYLQLQLLLFHPA